MARETNYPARIRCFCMKCSTVKAFSLNQADLLLKTNNLH
jgi:hypothetical protein